MNILITHAYSLEQKGDSALLVGTIAQLHETFPQASLTAQVMGTIGRTRTYEGAHIQESIIYLALSPDRPKYARPARMLYTFAGGLLWAVLSRVTGKSQAWLLAGKLKSSSQALYDADLVVPVAGGYISGQAGFFSTVNLVFVLLPLWMAHILHKPVIHFAQSIGPLGNGFQRWLASRTLRRAKLIFTRESVSTTFTHKLGIAPTLVHQSIDVGFLFQPAKFKLARAFEPGKAPAHDRPLVGITTKEHLARAEQSRYEHELAKFRDWCTTTGLQIVFVPQITSPELDEDDRIINRRIYSYMQHPDGAYLIEKNLSNFETKAVISQLDYMVGTRFHGVIFALTAYVPSIAIEYEHKTRGIMRDLDLDKWFTAMSGLTADTLIHMQKELISQRSAYVSHLRRHLPAYLEQAATMRTLMKDIAKHTPQLLKKDRTPPRNGD